MTFVSTSPGNGYRHSPGNTRGRLARDVAAMIAGDYGNWREAIGQHVADGSADQVIARLAGMVRPARLARQTAIAMQGE
jgi:hypothetical protein